MDVLPNRSHMKKGAAAVLITSGSERESQDTRFTGLFDRAPGTTQATSDTCIIDQNQMWASAWRVQAAYSDIVPDPEIFRLFAQMSKDFQEGGKSPSSDPSKTLHCLQTCFSSHMLATGPCGWNRWIARDVR